MSVKPPKPPKTAREERLAAALKRNIARRKQVPKPGGKK